MVSVTIVEFIVKKVNLDSSLEIICQRTGYWTRNMFLDWFLVYFHTLTMEELDQNSQNVRTIMDIIKIRFKLLYCPYKSKIVSFTEHFFAKRG